MHSLSSDKHVTVLNHNASHRCLKRMPNISFFFFRKINHTRTVTHLSGLWKKQNGAKICCSGTKNEKHTAVCQCFINTSLHVVFCLYCTCKWSLPSNSFPLQFDRAFMHVPLNTLLYVIQYAHGRDTFAQVRCQVWSTEMWVTGGK